MTDIAHFIDERMTTGRWVLLATILAASMAFIDGSALNVALPTLQADLQATGAQLLWINDAYLVMLASLILFGGSLGDKLGRKRVYMAGIIIFVSASLACGLAPTVQFLLAMRVLQGIGGALMIPGSLALITAFFTGDERGPAIGTWSGATTAVTVAGPMLGGFLAGIGFWRGVFFINIPLGIIALAALYFKVPESRDEDAAAIDYPGATLATLGLGALAYGFIAAPEQGWNNFRVYGPLALGLVGLAAFLFVEVRSSHPMMPLSLFRSRTFTGANLLTLFLYGALSTFSFFLPLNLVQTQGYSQFNAGLAATPFAILLALISRWAGKAVNKYGPRRLLTIGPATTGLGFLALGFVGLTPGPAAYWRTYLPGVLMIGLGMGLTVAPLSNTVMSALKTERAGTASGINNAVSRTASVLAIAIVGGLALIIFTGSLMEQTASLDLSPAAQEALQQEADHLGEASVPSAVSADQETAVAQAIDHAFVEMFQTVMFICTGLAWLSASLAAWLIREEKQTNEK